MPIQGDRFNAGAIIRTQADEKNTFWDITRMGLVPPTVGVLDEPRRWYPINLEWAVFLTGQMWPLTEIPAWDGATDDMHPGPQGILEFLVGLDPDAVIELLCDDDANEAICEIRDAVEDYMSRGAVLVYDVEGNEYTLCGCTITPRGNFGSGVSTNQGSLAPNADTNGYITDPTDFAGEQFGGAKVTKNLTACEISTAFVVYLLDTVESFIERVVNFQQAATAVPDALFAIADDFPILGSIARNVYESLVNFPADVLLDAEGYLDDPSYRYTVQRAMYGLVVGGSGLTINRGLVSTWARNTPFTWGPTFTPMQSILFLAVQSIDYKQAQRIGDTFRGNGDPELCQLFAEDTGKYPAPVISTGSGTVAQGFYTLPAVRSTFNDDSLPTGTPSTYTTVANFGAGSLPAGAIAGVLITLISYEHSSPDSNGSTVRCGLFDESQTDLFNGRLGISDIGGFSSATFEDANAVVLEGEQILVTEVQALRDVYPNAVTPLSAAIPPSQPFEITMDDGPSTQQVFGVSLNSFAGSTVLNATLDVQLIIDAAILPQ